jgi:PAS domain S-box-containing protein
MLLGVKHRRRASDISHSVAIRPAQPLTLPVPRTLDRLRGLLEVSRLVRAGADLPDLLDAIARTTAEALGFRTVAVNVRRPAWDDYEVAAVHGPPEARVALLGTTNPRGDWQALLDERFERRGAYYVRHGEVDWSRSGVATFVPSPSANGSAGWHPEDALFAPLVAADGELLGIISVDEPVSGAAPGDEELDVLVAVAAHAAQAIEAARETAETARHKDSLDQLLRVSSQLAGPHTMDEVLQSVCDGIQAALGFHLVVIELADREADRFVPRAAAGLDVAHDEIRLEAPIECLRKLFDPTYEREGCYLLERDEALSLVGAEPTGFRSTWNGHGPAAWNRHWLIVPLHDPAGEVSGFIWVDDPQDRLIPSRPRLQALRTFANHAETAIEAAARFDELTRAYEDRRALIDASPVGFVVLGRDRLVRAWNPAAQRMFGYSEGEVVGREPAWIAESERQGFRRRFDELLEGRGERETVYADRRADGTTLEVHTSSVLLRGADGEVTGVLAAIADITEQRRAEREREAAEEALRRSEERQRALISSSPVAIVALDAAGRVESWNPAAERIFGWTEAEVVGDRSRRCWHASSAARPWSESSSSADAPTARRS